VDHDLGVHFAKLIDEKKGVVLKLGVVLPIFALPVLAGVVCPEGDDGDIGFEGEGVLEVGSFHEGPVGRAQHAEGGSREGLDLVGLAEEVSKDGGIAFGLAWLCARPEGDRVPQDGDLERSGDEVKRREEEDD